MMPRLVIALIFVCFVADSVQNLGENAHGIGEQDETFNIVGGRQVARNSFPWTASLTMPAIGFRQCGVTIIAANWLITAGHCFSEYIYNEDWSIEIGGYEKNDVVEKIGIDKIFVHEKFDNRNFTFNDIALVKLNKTITSFHEPLPLASYELLAESEQFILCKIIGWGAEEEKGNQMLADSPFLREAEVPLVDIYECSKHYKHFQIDPNTQLCAGGRGSGSCFGDSGGPLQCWHKRLRHWFLVGLISYGIPCGHQGIPDVYTSIPAFKEWVKEIMEQNR